MLGTLLRPEHALSALFTCTAFTIAAYIVVYLITVRVAEGIAYHLQMDDTVKMSMHNLLLRLNGLAWSPNPRFVYLRQPHQPL